MAGVGMESEEDPRRLAELCTLIQRSEAAGLS
jgi:hypothetical protein